MALIPFQKGLKIKQTRQSTRLKPFVPVKRAPRDITQNYENIRKQAQQYADEAKKQSSWQSLALNTIKGLPQATRDIWSNVKQHPVETTKSVGSGILKGLEPFHKAQQWSNPAYLISKGIDKVAGTQLAKPSEDAWDRMANYEPKNNINRGLKQGFEFGASTVPYSVGGELMGATKLAETSPRLAKYLGWAGTSQAISDKKLTDVKGRAEQLALDTALFGLTGGMKKPKIETPELNFETDKLPARRELASKVKGWKKPKFELMTSEEINKLPKLDREDYTKYIKPKADNLAQPREGERFIVFSGDGKKGQYVDLDIKKALNRGVNKDTRVMVVDNNLLEKPTEAKAKMGERILKEDIFNTNKSQLAGTEQGLTENSSNLYHNDINETIPTPKTSEYKKSTPLDQVPLKDKLSYASSVADNPRDVKYKVAFQDYFKTPKYVLEKIGLGKQAEKLDRAYETYQKDVSEEMNKVIDWKKELPSEKSSRNIFKWLDGQDVQLTDKEKQVGEKIKKYLSDWADKLGLPEDKRITHYITHIFDKNLLQKEFDPELAKIIADKPAGSVYDPFLQKRLGKQGYKEDVWSALSAYVKRATRKYNLDPALKDLKNSSKFQSLENVKYITRLTHGVNMRPTELDNLIDNAIKQSPIGYKFGQRPINLLTRNIRQQIYRGGLGLNVGSALKNLSQGINTYAELGEKYTAKGYLDLITKGTKELKDVGVLDNGLIEDKSLPVYKSLLQKADKALFYLFEKAEMINRGSAYYGAKAKALAKGMSEEKAQAYAKNIVAKTQFKFGGVHTPVAMNSDLAKTLLQFQTFGLKQLEFVGGKVKNKEWKSLLRYIGGTLAVYGLIGKSIGWDVGDISIPSFRFSSPTTSILGSAYEYATAQGDKYKQAKARNDLMRSASLLVPAGGQLKKTYQGLGAYNRGYSQTPSGNVRFPVAKSTRNLIQAPTLGQWSLPEAKTYFQTKANSLGKNQTKTFRSLPEDKRKDFYNKILYDREINKFDRDIKEARKNHDEELIKKLINEKNKIKPYY